MIDFNQLIDSYLKRDRKERVLGRYYPSEVGGCLRRAWFSFKDPKETDPSLARVFEAGNLVHDLVTKVFKSDKNPDVELLGEELPFEIENDDFIISGRIDDLILLKGDGRKVLVEVKSTSNIDYVDEPSEEYIMQLQLYLHKMGIPDGILLFVEKNTLRSKSFNIKHDEKIANQVMRRFYVLHQGLIEDKMPPAEAKINKKKEWLCRNCQWKDKCD